MVWFSNTSFLCTRQHRDDYLSDSDTENVDISEDENSRIYDESNDSCWTDSLVISDYVILNPHWLLSAMKGVLTHKLSGDVSSIRFEIFPLNNF